MEPGVPLAELLEEVRRVELAGRRLVTEVLAGGHLSAFRGTGIQFDDVREYAEGDDPRTVDWKVTARTGRPFVKRFVDERERTVLFLLDLSPSMAGGYGAWSARQAAARVAAVLALAAVRHGDRTGLVAFDREVRAFVPPRKGSRHALRIVRDTLALPASGEATDLVPALEFAARAVRRGALVFVLSDFLADGWQDAMALCAIHHEVIAVRFLVPERDLPAGGLVRLRDPESGRDVVVDLAHGPTRAHHERRAAEARERTARDLLLARVDLLEFPVPAVPGPTAVAGPILRFFEARGRHGRRRGR